MSSVLDLPVSTKLRSHIPALDGLRGIAVLLVIVHHFAGRQELGTGFTKVFFRFCEIGWSGVDLFFVLSGFLITGILLQAKHQTHPIRTFFARRTLRIFPLYYLSLVVLIFVWPALSSSPEDFVQLRDNQAWYWSYLTNFLISLDVPTGPIDTGHFWSLAVEEQFYMVWPFVVLFTSIGKLRRICISLIIVALVFRTSCFLAGWGHSPAYVLTISRLDALGLGALVATMLREPTLRDLLFRHWNKLFVGFAILFVALVVAQGSFRRGPLMLSAGLTVLAALFALTIASVASDKHVALRRILETSFLRFFGKYSYAMYVVHPFVLTWMSSWFSKWISSTGWEITGLLRFFVFTIIGLTVTSIAALLSWNLFERWFLSLKKYFEPKPAPTP